MYSLTFRVRVMLL